MSNATVQSLVETSNTRHIPVNKKVLRKILKAMDALGIVWDGSINHVDAFCRSSDTAMFDWLLLRARNAKTAVYVRFD